MRYVWILIISALIPANLAAQASVNVRVKPLRDVLVDFERKAPAEVKALNDSTLAAEVAAVVMSVEADAGQAVSKEELLLQLDPTDYELNLQQARANLDSSRARLAQAEAKLERARSLGSKDYVSADELLARETDVMVFRAQIQVDEVALSIAQRNLDKCRLVAPFDGVVVERMAQVGNFVRNGDPLISVTQVDRFELDAQIPDSHANETLLSGDIRFESRGDSWPVTLLRLSPVIDAQGRTRQARFGFVSAAPAIGRSGELVWQVASGMLPANLVSRRNGELGVFILDADDTARFEPLPGAQEGRPVAIALSPSSRVVTLGREQLQHGMAVVVQQ